MSDTNAPLSFFARVAMAFACFFRILFVSGFAERLLPVYRAGAVLPAATKPEAPSPRPTPVAPAPEKEHASGLFLLSLFQREGRLVDFLQEDVAAYPDADVGAVARVVHEGCRKVVHQYLSLEPVLPHAEGDAVNVPQGFDAQRIRLTGNVAGVPPWKGSLRHHGWVTKEVRIPDVPDALDPKVIAPAEVELA
jgi:hypothetical protein